MELGEYDDYLFKSNQVMPRITQKAIFLCILYLWQEFLFFFSFFLFYVELSHGGTKTAHQLSKITSGVLRRIPQKKPQTRKNLKQETPKKISLEKLPRILIETKKL